MHPAYLIARRPILKARSVSCGNRLVNKNLENVCIGTLSV